MTQISVRSATISVLSIVRRWLVLFVASLLTWGCGGEYRAFLPLDSSRLKPGAVVVVHPTWSDEENRAVAERAARLLAQELGARWGNVRSHDGAGSIAPWESSDVGTVVVVEVALYEQYWDRLTKITRVGLEAHMIHLSTGRPLWGGRFDAKVKGHPGWAFDKATRLAVRGLAAAMDREVGGWLRGGAPPGRE